MKKILPVLVFLLVLTFAFSAFADYQTVEVYVNGDILVADSPAILVGSRTMVPLRAISEKLGCDVSWDDKTQTAEIKNNKTAVYVTIDSDIMVKKDVKAGKSENIRIDAPAMLYKSRTMIPLRAVSEALDAKVDWDSEKECALITVNKVSGAYGVTTEDGYVSDELDIAFDAIDGVTMVGYSDGKFIKEIAKTAEDVDYMATTEFAAIFENYGANITFAVGPETEVKPEEYLEYFKSVCPTNQDGYVYLPALKIEDSVVGGVNFKKLGYIVQNGENKFNWDYYAGIVNGRIMITATFYTDGSREKAFELLNCIRFNLK